VQYSSQRHGKDSVVDLPTEDKVLCCWETRHLFWIWHGIFWKCLNYEIYDSQNHHNEKHADL